MIGNFVSGRLSAVMVDAVTSPVNYSEGFAYDSTGQLLMFPSAAGLPDGVCYTAGIARTSYGAACVRVLEDGATIDQHVGGLPVTSAGELVVDAGTAIGPYVAGKPITTSGALATTDTPPAFRSTLQTSLVPDIAGGSPTPTFTRATAASQTGFDGKSNLVPSGCARFQGARRVYNTVSPSSEAFTAYTARAGVGHTGNSIVESSNNNDQFILFLTNITVSGIASVSRIKLKQGTRRYARYCFNTGGGEAGITVDLQTGTITNTFATAPWTLTNYGISAATDANGYWTLTINGTSAGTAYYVLFGPTDSPSAGAFYTYAGDGASNIFATQFQEEITTGKTNTTFSEYVSVGVLSAPYHGAGVDGVKYFNTLNGNTVTNNVVTEATGAPIVAGQAGVAATAPVDANGPYGYLSEGARTNAILQSNTLGTTWTVSNAADMNAVAADAYVSVDGTTTMDKLQPKATTAVHSLDQAFTFTAAQYTTSADLRYVAATSQRWVALICNDGTTTWGASFDLLNGVVGAVSAGATSTIEATALTGVYRVSVTNTANAAAAAGTVKISLNATDTATLESAARAGTETLGAGMVQHEIGTFKSSRIITTTVAVTKNASVDQYVSAGNVPTNNFTLYGEVAWPVVPTAASYYLWGSYVDVNNSTAILWDGTNLIARRRIGGTSHDATIAFAPTANTRAKWAATFSSVDGTQIYLSGTAGTADATTTACQIEAAFQIGADGNGAGQPYAETPNNRVYPVAISASKLQAMTTP